ncbi:MAG: exodeoxyribonuclease VII large subunit [Novosphingobium sp.]
MWGLGASRGGGGPRPSPAGRGRGPAPPPPPPPTTLADFAADLRAPTPTAAAEIAVPVREELFAQLADLALRKRKCALRPVALGRERLEARAQRLPKPEAILAAKTQQLDDLADRLRRGLGQRIVQARLALQQDAARLSAPLLSARVRHERHRLDSVRLNPALVTGRIAAGTERLAALSRLAQSLHPDKPLARGYVRVTAANGETLVSKAEAGREASLVLHFGDGELAVMPLDSRTPPPRRPSSPQKPPPPEQGKLL